MQDELRNNGYNATVTDNGDGTFTVKFESGREYTINADGSISNEPGTGGGTGETPGNPDGEGYFTEDRMEKQEVKITQLFQKDLDQ